MYKGDQAIQSLNAVAKFLESSERCLPPEAIIPEFSEFDKVLKTLIADEDRTNVHSNEEVIDVLTIFPTNEPSKLFLYTSQVITNPKVNSISEESVLTDSNSSSYQNAPEAKSETNSANIPENLATPKGNYIFENSIPTKDNSTVSDADEIISRISETFADLNESENFEKSPTTTTNTPNSRKNSSYISEHIEGELPELDLSPISRQTKKPETESSQEIKDLLLAQKLIYEDWEKYVKLNKANTCAENNKKKCNEEYLDRLKHRAEIPRNDSCSSLSHKAKRRAESLSPLIQRRQTHTNIQEGGGNKLRHSSSVGSKLNLSESDASKAINFKV